MSRNAVVLLILLGSLLGVKPAGAAKVAFFADPAFVDMNAGQEGLNTQAALTAAGHTVAPFTGVAAATWQAVLDTSDVLVVPEIEVADLNAAMGEDTRAVIVRYVVSGKPMVLNMDNGQHFVPFLNALFGYSLVFSTSVSSGTAVQQAGVAGTAFAGAPANIPMPSATTSIAAASAPPGTRVLYTNGADPVAWAAQVGAAGRLVCLGYDWFGSPPAEWNQLLNLAIQFGRAATPTFLKVAMFGDNTYVDMSPGQEGLQMKAAMEAAGHTVNVFTGTAEPVWTAALANADVLVIPEEENAPLAPDLPAQTKAAIQKFVLGGGGLLVNAAGSDALLNLLFGYSVTFASGQPSYALSTGAAAGTPFAAGPGTLPQSNAVSPMTTTTLPAGSLSLYTNGTSAAVWAAGRGLGHLVYAGFDWFAPSANQVFTPWLPLLNTALQFAAQPVVLAPNAPGQPAGTNAPVTVNLVNVKNMTSSSLRFRAGGDANFSTLALAGPVTAATASIPGATLTNKGVQYFIEFSDGNGTGTFPRNAPHVALNLPVTLTNQSVLSLPGASAFTLGGIGMAATDPSPTAIFDELGGYDVTKWRYGTFDGAVYHEPGGGAANATPGQGFWIIARNAAGISASGTSTDLGGNVLVTLHPGFNQIADPFAFPVDFADVVLPANVQNNLIGFDGSSYQPNQTTLAPGKGYWIKNDNAGNVVIAIPPLGAGVAPVPRAALTATDGWSMQVSAHAGRYADVGNVLGMKSGALEGRDAFDLSDPPVPPAGWVRLGFPEPGEGDLLADWRPRSSSGNSWDVVFASDQAGEPFTIDLVPSAALPAGWGVVAFDGDREVTLGSPARITGVVGSSTAPHTYRVSVGNAEYLAAIRTQALATVTSFALAAPFPNPTSGRVSVDLSLPRAESDVRVEVYDANGRLVRSVASGPFAAGVHRIEWDGRTTGGDRAGAGLYFVRAKAGAASVNRKVALIP